MTVPRTAALAYLDWLDAHPQPHRIASRLVAERIVRDMQQPVITEQSDGLCLEAGYDEQGAWHRPDAAEWRDKCRNCGRFLLCYTVGAALAVALVVHFAQKAGLPW